MAAAGGLASSPVSEFINDSRAVHLALPVARRPLFENFWSRVRGRILELCRQNAALSQQVRDLQRVSAPISSAPRPDSSSPTIQGRVDNRAVMNAATEGSDPSATIASIHDLPAHWVRARLQADRRATEENREERWAQLGCWMAAESSNHTYGYTKVNWRNTYRPDSHRRIGSQPFRHQLAVVARGEGADLLRTVDGGGYEVSHGCNNGRCFNPDHLWVEPKAVNQARKGCVGAWIVRFWDGTIYHPCPHIHLGPRRHCLLPRRELPQGRAYYQNTADQGPVAR